MKRILAAALRSGRVAFATALALLVGAFGLPAQAAAPALLSGSVTASIDTPFVNTSTGSTVHVKLQDSSFSALDVLRFTLGSATQGSLMYPAASDSTELTSATLDIASFKGFGPQSFRVWVDLPNASGVRNKVYDAGERTLTGWFTLVGPPAGMKVYQADGTTEVGAEESLAAGSCRVFTATVKDANGNPVSGQRLQLGFEDNPGMTPQPCAADALTADFKDAATAKGTGTSITTTATGADGKVRFAVQGGTTGSWSGDWTISVQKQYDWQTTVTQTVTMGTLSDPPGAPGEPTEVGVIAANGSAVVSWSGPSDTGSSPIEGFVVLATEWPISGARANLPVAQCNTSQRRCSLNGLVNGVRYGFVVRAVNLSGAGRASVTVFAIPVPLPSAPSGLVTSPGDREVTVRWSAPLDSDGTAVLGYTVTATPGGAACSVSGKLECTVANLINGVPYTFHVVSRNELGLSPPSEESAAATPRSVPDSPQFLAIVPGDGQLDVSWDRPASDGGSPIIGYDVSAVPGPARCTTGQALSCVITGLTNGVGYHLRLVAVNEAGNSGPSESGYVVPMTTPDAPTRVTAVARDGAALVSWSAPSFDGGSSVTGYRVTAFPGEARCETNGLACEVEGLRNRQTYAFKVTAMNAAGTSPESALSATVMPLTPGFQIWTSSQVVAIGTSTTLQLAQAPAHAGITFSGAHIQPVTANIVGSASAVFSPIKTGLVKLTATYTQTVGKKSTKRSAVTSVWVPSVIGPGNVKYGKSGSFKIQYCPAGADIAIAMSDGRTLDVKADSAGRSFVSLPFVNRGAVLYDVTIDGVLASTGGLAVY